MTIFKKINEEKGVIFKKEGSIIPKRFLTSVEKKGQHRLTFGCDVKIVGNTIYPLTVGCVFLIPYVTHVNLKKNKGNNKKTWKGSFMGNGVFIDGSLCEGGSHNSTMIHMDLVPTPFTINHPYTIGINTSYNVDQEPAWDYLNNKGEEEEDNE